jgi:hypothetical protein
MKLINKNTIGWLMIVGGSFLIMFANHASQKISEGKGFIKGFTGFFTNMSIWGPVASFFGAKAYDKASEHDASVLVLLVSGIILVIGGLIVLFQKKFTRIK